MRRIERALISVYDKTGIVEFATALANLKVEIISTGGTSRLLRSNGVVVRDVSDLTSFPEILDGRVKTLNPRIAGGLLAIRNNTEHMKQVAAHEIPLIDLVCVNLYPFSETINKLGFTNGAARLLAAWLPQSRSREKSCPTTIWSMQKRRGISFVNLIPRTAASSNTQIPAVRPSPIRYERRI